MNIAVLEDNPLQQERIYNLLKYEHRVDIFSCCHDYKISNKQYDLLLLDIELGQENGIEFIQKNKDKQTFIVYVSSHDECMENVFDTNVLGFIKKIGLEEKLISKIYQVQQKLNNLNKVELHIPHNKILVNEQSIIKFELNKAITVYLTNSKYTLVNETLKEIEKELSSNFIRANNHTIINIHYIQRINQSNHSILLSNNETIHISIRRWNDVKAKYIEMRTNI